MATVKFGLRECVIARKKAEAFKHLCPILFTPLLPGELLSPRAHLPGLLALIIHYLPIAQVQTPPAS